MFSNFGVVIISIILCLVHAQDNTEINTGGAFYALSFPQSGQASVTLPASLSKALPLSFSFESWVMLPGTLSSGTQVTTADGLYKTIVSHYTVQPDGTYANTFADFDLQVQKTGNINFFMGSGIGGNPYGAIVSGPVLQADVWTHIAFTVYTAAGDTNPDTIILYVDGHPYSTNWMVGERQLLPSVSMQLGSYMNQDGDVKWWLGYMDEVRFWSTALSQQEITDNMGMLIAPNTTNLLAYYKCDSGSVLVDATPNAYNGEFVSAAASIQYVMSGVKLGYTVVSSRNVANQVTLLGVGTAPFVYVISSIPSSSAGVLKDGTTTLTSSNLPYTLSGNTITFVTGNNAGVDSSFQYYGMNSAGREPNATTVVLQVAPCNPDACGVCGGNNSTCNCLSMPYMGYSVAQLEVILAWGQLDMSLELLDSIEMSLEQASDELGEGETGGDINYQFSTVQNFREVCLTDLNNNLKDFLSQLS